MRALRSPLLYLIVFVSGATVMSTEMGATRLLAPYFGTSLIIWANLIGLILIYLTVGYYFGGRLADRFPRASALYKLTAWAGFAIVLVPIVSRPLLLWSALGFEKLSAGIFFGSFFAIVLLFAVPVTLLGTVSPWAIRLHVKEVSEAGHSAGTLYALSTVGSILGTFLPVLVLQPSIGTRASIWAFGVILLAASLVGLLWEVGRRAAPYAAMLAAALLLVYLFHGGSVRAAAEGELLFEDESPYNYIQVVRDRGWTELILNEGLAIHSLYNPHQLLTGGPWDYFLLAPLFRPEGAASPPRDVLVIGLAAGTIPHQYSVIYPHTHVDGVELDGEIVALGRKYFDMREPQLDAIVGDGRYYLLTTRKKYDVIAIDAYQQPYIPFHLATREFFELARRHLRPGGVVVINAGRPPGDYRLVNALGSTMASVYPSVYAVDVGGGYYNSLVFATREPTTLHLFMRDAGRVGDPTLRRVVASALATGNVRRLAPTRAAFTDDLAPVEQVIDQIIVDYASKEVRR